MDSGQHAEQKGSRFTRSIISFAVMVVLVIGLSWLLRTFVIQGYTIPSGSMEDTLMIGDTVFCERLSYDFGTIKQGDIITFQDPEIDGRILIKRCIAVAGQTVDFKDGYVVIDGVPRSEAYTLGKPSAPLSNTIVDISYPYTVPDGYIWVMGDNRTNSQDSRYFGPIPTTSVFGRAFMTYWPLEHIHLLQ
ncbi:MAG: signal peptidase I [Eggerthellaceae bacterium]|nr:signal peptidase I [Eggerthellaceae bacterium]